jgi:hypothetical protein
MKRTPYQFALVGTPGKGKTMSLRNMNPKTCGFINMEGKPLPFVNNFAHFSTPDNWQECYQKLIEYAKNDEITEVVLDSFSSFLDSLVKQARKDYKNFDIWNFYNERVGQLLYLIKRYPKDLIVTAHYEWVESGDSGAVEKRIAVKGKEWKGMVEKEFTIVNFADVKVIDGKRHYIMELNSDGKSSAKTPPMFLKKDEEQIDNDYNAFLLRVREVLNKSSK